MKRITTITLTIAFLSFVFLLSCNEPITPPESTYNTVMVNSNIEGSTIWTNGNIYVINKSDFYVEGELTIEPGVIVKFPSNYAFLTLGNNGKITANGSSDKHIIFTSYKDDNNGGDTNDDQETSTPSRGSWGTIDLNGHSGSNFSYCDFYYGGMGSSPEPTLSLSAGALATVVSCSFKHNAGGKSNVYFIGALDAKDADNNTTIRNNLFVDNGLPLTMFSEIDIDASNNFYQNGNGNDMNGIFVNGNIGKNTEWLENEVAFVVTNFDMSIFDGYTLKLGDNVVLKFIEDSRLNLIGGISALDNYDGNEVLYTSIKDDSRKGDTNGDSNITSAVEEDWIGIFLDDYKGGYAAWQNIYFNNPNATVK